MKISVRLVLAIGIPSIVFFLADASLAQMRMATPSAEGQTVVVENPAGAAAPMMVVPPGGRSGYSRPPGGPGRPGMPGGPPTGPGGKPAPPSGKPGESKKPDDKGKESKDEKKDEKKDGDKKEGESSETKKRPTEPPKAADPEELKVLPDKDGKVQFNFNGQPWEGVLKWLAGVSGKSLDWQEMPGDYLNLVTQRSYTLDEARDLINFHLLARGFTLLGDDEVLSVVKIDKLNPGMVPRVSPDELADRLPHEFVKVSFELDWLMADAAVEELKPMLSPNGKLTALKTTNRIEAIDAVINLREVYAVLKEEQSDTGLERLFQEFKLKHSDCEEVLQQLQTLLGVEKKSAGPMSKEQMEAAKRAAMMAAQQAKQGKAPAPKPKANVNLVADRRKNSILVNAPPDKMAFIEKAIETLDMPAEDGSALLQNPDLMHVYRLESIQAETLIKTLEDLGDMDFFTKLEVDQENNAIVAYASFADHLMIRSLIEKLDNGSRRFEALQLKEGLRAESVVEVIDFMMGGAKEEEKKESSGSSSSRYSPFFSPFGRSSSSRSRSSSEHRDSFRVDADAKTNTLHLWCNDFELKKVESLLESMGAVPREGGEPHTLEVYRLVSIDPQVLADTLDDMNHLEYHTKLEVDEGNNSIVAYATKADHAKIDSLIKQLDGSGRQFEVIPLRLLEADYLAGTIKLMMLGKGDQQQSGYSRTYNYYDIYGPSNSKGSDKKNDEFRVDADVEFNRLLVWANEIELNEVKNLLVKLGEIPADGGDPRTIRVIDSLPPDEVERILERIRKAWPSVAPNELLVEPVEKTEEESKGDSKDATDEKESKPAATPGARAAARSSGDEPAPARDDIVHPAVRFARFDSQQAEKAPAEKSPAEKSPQAAPAVKAESDSVQKKAPTAESLDASPAEPPAEAPAQPAAAPEKKSQEPSVADKPAAPADPTPQVEPGKRPPVSITRGPDGRLVISSEDTKALDQLEQLMAELAPPRQDYEIFRLKVAWAYSVALTLEDIFDEKEKDEGRGRSSFYDYYYGYGGRSSNNSDDSVGLSKRRPLKFISDTDSNTILVQGADAGQLAKIAKLIEFYDQPEPTDSQSVRKTEVVQLRYTQASTVAETVKEVYRDLLSANDKSLQKGQQPQQERRYTLIYSSDNSEGERMPTFKGLLSIGVDDLSNTLVISAPMFLFDDVLKIVESLDEAAEPTTTTVRVMQMGQGVSAGHVQQVLSNVLGGKSSRGKSPPGPQAPQPPGPPNSNGPGSSRGMRR